MKRRVQARRARAVCTLVLLVVITWDLAAHETPIRWRSASCNSPDPSLERLYWCPDLIGPIETRQRAIPETDFHHPSETKLRRTDAELHGESSFYIAMSGV